MKIWYAAPGYHGHEQADLLLRSAKVHGITVDLYGGDAPWPGWTQGKLTDLVPELERRAGDYTHVLFMDAFDSLIFGPSSEIERAYREYGSPPVLLSAEKNCWPQSIDYRRYKYDLPNGGMYGRDSLSSWRYLNPGGWIAEIPYAIDRIRLMLSKWNFQNDDMSYWQEAYLSGDLPGAVIDTWCSLFQCMVATSQVSEVVMGENGPVNLVTATAPLVVHWNGRATGREEWFELAYGKG